MTRYFHGGQPGLKIGDYVTPQGHDPGWKRDDCAICANGNDDSHLPDKVFVTPNREYARYYASRFGKGWLYVVEPVGTLELSTADADIPSWSCDRARVISIYERAVVLTHAQRWRVFRMMSPPDEHPVTTKRKFNELIKRAALLAAASRVNKAQRDEEDQLDADIAAVTAELGES